MGLATIDPKSQKEHTKIHKIPKFGANQASFHSLTYRHLKTKKIYKEMYGNADKCGQEVRICPHFFTGRPSWH